jgi:hypothetical protein
VLTVVVLERWGYWGRGSAASGDPTGDDGRHTRCKDVSSFLGRCLAFEMPKAEG